MTIILYSNIQIFIYIIGPIKPAFSNFGNIPYGYFTLGRLRYDPTNVEKDYACRPLNNYNLEKDNDLDKYPIIMVDRGNCTFVAKARNVQNAGGHLALIIDNTDEDVHKLMMADDGTGRDIQIPAILVSKKEGDILKKFFVDNQNDRALLDSIIISVEFEIVSV